MINYKTIGQFSAESGYTEAAVRKMIDRQIWKNREVWVKVSGRVLIIVEGYHNWVEVEAGLKPHRKQQYKSNLSIRGNPVGNGLSFS